MLQKSIECRKLCWFSLMSRKTKTLLLIFVAFLLFLLIYLFWVRKDMSDFGVCYQGGKRIVAGETLYQTADGHLQYKYSPASAMFFALFSFLPQEMAKFIWYFSQLFLFYMVLLLSYKILPSKLEKRKKVVLLSFLIVLKFLAREIELGQVNVLIIFLLVIALVSLLKKRDTEAGFCWGITLFFKPYALVFFPYFIIKKRIKLVATGIGVALVGIFLPVLFYGIKGNMLVLKEWYHTLSLSTPALVNVYDNASLHAFFLKVVPHEDTKLVWIFILICSIIIGFSFLWMMIQGKRRDLGKQEVLEFSFLLVLIPLFSPLGWYYNYLYSILAVVILLAILQKFPSVLRYLLVTNFIIIGASLIEILGKDIFRFYTGYSLVVINYFIILFFLFYSRARNLS
jgi:hypothetical protein